MSPAPAKALALAGVLIALPLVSADGCNESRDTVDVHEVFIDVGGTPRAVGVDDSRTRPEVNLVGGNFTVAAGIAGTLVVRYGSATDYTTCLLDLEGQRNLPVQGAPNGHYEVRMPSKAMAPGRTVNASITCTPRSALSLPATTTFTVSTEASGQLAPSPESLNFGTVPVGARSDPQTVTYRNVGHAPVHVRADQYGSWIYGGYELDRENCRGATLPVGSSCTIALRARPDATSTMQMDLTLQSDALLPTRMVRITGTTGARAAFSASAATLDFGGVDVGSSADRTLTVSNTGQAPFTVYSSKIEHSNQFTIDSDTCTGRTLFAGGTCTVTLRFAPTMSGYATATVTFQDSAPGDAHSVTLTGIGNAPAPSTNNGGYPYPP